MALHEWVFVCYVIDILADVLTEWLVGVVVVGGGGGVVFFVCSALCVLCVIGWCACSMVGWVGGWLCGCVCCGMARVQVCVLCVGWCD